MLFILINMMAYKRAAMMKSPIPAPIDAIVRPIHAIAITPPVLLVPSKPDLIIGCFVLGFFW